MWRAYQRYYRLCQLWAKTKINMSQLKDKLSGIAKIHNSHYQTEVLKQFTIDMIEDFMSELHMFIDGEEVLNGESVVGSLSYRASTALEICDDSLPDFYVIQELYDIINS